MIDSVKNMKKVVSSKINDYSYKNNKEKTETDEQLRNYLISHLSKQLDLVVALQDVALSSAMLMIWGDLDRLIRALRDARLNVQETDYKGTTFFISTKTFVKDELLVYEYQAIQLLKKMDVKLFEFNESVESAFLGEISQYVSEIINLIQDLIAAWNERTSKIRSFKSF